MPTWAHAAFLVTEAEAGRTMTIWTTSVSSASPGAGAESRLSICGLLKAIAVRVAGAAGRIAERPPLDGRPGRVRDERALNSGDISFGRRIGDIPS